MTTGKIAAFRWRVVCCCLRKLEMDWLRTRDLLTEVSFFDPWIVGEVLRWTFHHYSACFQNVSAVGMAERGMGVLLDEQDGRALAFDLVDSLEDRVNDQRRESQ